MDNRPNIVLLMADMQLQAALGCYGNVVIQTPHIDSIAQSGVHLCLQPGLTVFTMFVLKKGKSEMAQPNRHNDGANYLFKDGHVKWRKMRDWELGTDRLWDFDQ